MKPLSILLVDDDDGLRFALNAALLRRGYEVTQAPNVTSALSCLERRSFDVVLTDLLLEERDGIEVIRAAKKKYPDLRIVAMTGGGDYLEVSYLLHLARSFGACVQLAKPFATDELLAAVDPAPRATEHDPRGLS
jgi:Response regulator containing CheY-like receiver, AAA-type ATPase, and DNA-binding domains